MRKHLQRLAVNTGKVDPRLTLTWPATGHTVWWAFTGMVRTQGINGPGAISMTEIDAWQRVNDIRLTPWELDMIKVFDGIALEKAAK